MTFLRNSLVLLVLVLVGAGCGGGGGGATNDNGDMDGSPDVMTGSTIDGSSGSTIDGSSGTSTDGSSEASTDGSSEASTDAAQVDGSSDASLADASPMDAAPGPTLVSLDLTPASPTLAAGTTTQLTATGTYSDASTQNLTAQVTWSSNATANATVGTGAGAGLVTSVAVGSATITAALDGVMGTTTVTVSAAQLTSIGVTPASPSVAKGLTQQFTATGVFSDNSTQDLTTQVTWASGTPGTATISSAGLATTLGTGTTSITATLGTTVSPGVTLTVTPATLVSIAVTPASPAIVLGATQQFMATGTYTDNSTLDLTTLVTWASDTPASATISNLSGSLGLATSVALGTASITATLGAVVSPGDTLTVGCVTGTYCASNGLAYCSLDANCNNPIAPSAPALAPATCSAPPASGANLALDPATSWSASDLLTGDAYDPVSLPDTGGGDSYGYCDNCTRFFETTTCGVPKAVWFRWGSDNDAQLLVNGASAYTTYWDPVDGFPYCSDQVCCGFCCDSPEDCQNAIQNNPAGNGGWMQLGDLSAFTSGTNTITWELGQGGGGMGFYTEMIFQY